LESEFPDPCGFSVPIPNEPFDLPHLAFAEWATNDGAQELGLDPAGVGLLREAAADQGTVSGFTHNSYRYPARFSPRLARALIRTFTVPGELVLDPFLGGGTSAVEALASGRDCFGSDISSLATFVSKTKCQLVTDAEVQRLRAWGAYAASEINLRRPVAAEDSWMQSGYLRNMHTGQLWRLRKIIAQALYCLNDLPEAEQSIARCAVLRASQLSIEGRRTYPSVDQFRVLLAQVVADAAKGANEFSNAVAAAAGIASKSPKFICRHRKAEGLETEPAWSELPAPKLILTSPPYPGVHVLYHRWQVDGRKETPLPFWIADATDGSGESYYTMGHRGRPGLTSYFANLQASLQSLANLASAETMLAQVVAFKEPHWQLPKYLEAAVAAGWVEYTLPSLRTPDSRLWRRVPNRRWYADMKGATPGSFEVVLFHKLKS
jgi:hypothetical protein